ncbi:MAG: hypothetical protein GMKNLPBB_00788 [Myxococcota bacterium]|nr:hypothetical protein [Myxococcota bacterium]
MIRMAALGACLLFLLGGSGPARADTVRTGSGTVMSHAFGVKAGGTFTPTCCGAIAGAEYELQFLPLSLVNWGVLFPLTMQTHDRLHLTFMPSVRMSLMPRSLNYFGPAFEAGVGARAWFREPGADGAIRLAAGLHFLSVARLQAEVQLPFTPDSKAGVVTLITAGVSLPLWQELEPPEQ